MATTHVTVTGPRRASRRTGATPDAAAAATSRRGAWALLLALAAATATATSASAAPDGPEDLGGRHSAVLTTTETDCYELSVQRPANVAAVDAVVPERYEIRTTRLSAPAPGQPSVVAQLRLIDYSCTISVDRQQRERRSQVTLGLAQIVSRDGQPVTAHYLLWIGTDDPVLAARYRQVGLPAEYVPASTATLTHVSASQSEVAFSVVGDGLDHTASALVTETGSATGAPQPFTVYYVGSRGEVRLEAMSELTAPGAGVVSLDHRAVDGYLGLLNQPSAAVVDRRPLAAVFLRGQQTTRVERLD